MDGNFPNLNLEKFAHGYDSFFNAVIHVLKTADVRGVLGYILPEKICKQYKFSEYNRDGLGLMHFLENTYISHSDKEEFISLLNLVLPVVIKLYQKESYYLDQINRYLQATLVDFIDLTVNTNQSEVFDLDFYYDKTDKIFKKKLDTATTEVINQNAASFDASSVNRIRYEECVAEFLSFKQDVTTDKSLFYNQSLDKLKRIVENTLEVDYQNENGTFPKLSNKKQIANILFDNSHSEFESRTGYVLANIHHEQGGRPKKFIEKEYVYLWLELNQILYLLNRYKISPRINKKDNST
jgi:hypothetical protein